MNRQNNVWPFSVSQPTNAVSQINPQAMLNRFKQSQLLLQQQLQQNVDPHLLQQQFMNNNSYNQQSTIKPNMNDGRFSSAFSVNSLLGSSQQPLPVNQDKFANLNQNFASILTQHLAAAIANYRMQNNQSNTRNTIEASTNNQSSAFHQPSQKRAKLSDTSYDASMSSSDPDQIQTSQNQLNTSISSISSPSSSTSSTATSISIEYSNQTNLEYLNRMNSNGMLANRSSHQLDSANNAPSTSSTSSVSSASLNESDYVHNNENGSNQANESVIERVSPEMHISTPSSYYMSCFKNSSSKFY